MSQTCTRAREPHPPTHPSARAPAHARISRLAYSPLLLTAHPNALSRSGVGMAGDAGSACACVELNAALS